MMLAPLARRFHLPFHSTWKWELVSIVKKKGDKIKDCKEPPGLPPPSPNNANLRLEESILSGVVMVHYI